MYIYAHHGHGEHALIVLYRMYTIAIHAHHANIAYLDITMIIQGPHVLHDRTHYKDVHVQGALYSRAYLYIRGYGTLYIRVLWP